MDLSQVKAPPYRFSPGVRRHTRAPSSHRMYQVEINASMKRVKHETRRVHPAHRTRDSCFCRYPAAAGPSSPGDTSFMLLPPATPMHPPHHGTLTAGCAFIPVTPPPLRSGYRTDRGMVLKCMNAELPTTPFFHSNTATCGVCSVQQANWRHC